MRGTQRSGALAVHPPLPPENLFLPQGPAEPAGGESPSQGGIASRYDAPRCC
jgi:hypothetical protein